MKTLFLKSKVKKQNFYLKTVLVLMFLGQITITNAQDTIIKDILERFSTDYLNDPMFTSNHSFGINIDNKMWNIEAVVATKVSPSSIRVSKGQPSSPTFYYETNIRTLKQLDKGEINALTAGVKAFSTDYAPLDIEAMEGFVPNQEFVGDVLSFTFHFWTKARRKLYHLGNTILGVPMELSPPSSIMIQGSEPVMGICIPDNMLTSIPFQKQIHFLR